MPGVKVPRMKRVLVGLVACSLFACPPSIDSGDAGSSHDAGVSDSGVIVEDAGVEDAGVVDSGVLLDAGSTDAGDYEVTRLDGGIIDAGAPVVYELLRIRAHGHTAYAQWTPTFSTDGGLTPVIVLTRPYDGIGWTGEEVDERWANRGDGFYPDVDSPDAPADAGVISYVAITPQREVDDSFVWRFHGLSVLSVYGRFYAGGSIRDDVDDMTTGLEFLAHEPGVDTSRIAIFGGSWGGFEALYGAAYAPAAATPKVAVALYPPSDFAAEAHFALQTMPSRYMQPASLAACDAFFAPYLRRIVATTGGLPDAGGDFTGFDLASVTQRLRTPTLVVHDDYDTLVDVHQSELLTAAAPSLVSAVYLRHSQAANWDALLNQHGPEFGGFGGNGMLPFVVVRVLRAVSVSQYIYVPYNDDFGTLLTWARDQTRAGAPHHEVAARLRELIAPNVIMFNATNSTVAAGGDFVATAVNAVWGTSYTAANIDAALANGLPP